MELRKTHHLHDEAFRSSQGKTSAGSLHDFYLKKGIQPHHKYDVVLRMHCLDPMVFEVLGLNKERMIQRLRMPTLSVQKPQKPGKKTFHGNPMLKVAMFHRGKAMPTYLLEFLTSSESLGNINGGIKNPKR